MKLKYIFILSLLFSFSLISAQKKIVILHTNDTHSRIEPIPATDRNNPNMGGLVNRKAVVDSIRQVEKNVLLMDIGDFVQGTPYFNLFHGKVEAESMNMIKYDLGTLGNHEFDYGLDTLKKIVQTLDFPIIVCNYDFSGTPMEGLTKPYIIKKIDGAKIGILGVGCDPVGLIQKEKYEGMKYTPSAEAANEYAQILKNKEKCDIVICISHNGLNPDKEIAAQSKNIDIIIGGHSHSFMKEPALIKNSVGKDVYIYQVGKNGAYIGKTEIILK